jgi:hypothetical protein
MKRSYRTALLASAVVGLTGATVAVILSRQEGRAASRRFLGKAEPMAERAREAGEHIVQTAAEQYHVIAPQVAHLLQTARKQAPQAVEALRGALPRSAMSDKEELVVTGAAR